MGTDDQTPESEEQPVDVNSGAEEAVAPVQEEATGDMLDPDEEPIDLISQVLDRQQAEIKVPSREEVDALPTATMDDLRGLKAARLEQAVPFPLDSLGMKVMVAPCEIQTYMTIIGVIFNVEDGEDPNEAGFRANLKLVASCVVDPVIDDEEEFIEILKEGGQDVMELFTFCRHVSGVEGTVPIGVGRAVMMAEDFTGVARSS